MAVSINGSGAVTGVVGNIIQVVSNTSSTAWTATESSNTWRPFPGDELLTSITPRSSSSLFLLMGVITMGTDSNAVAFRFMRDGAAIGVGEIIGTRISGATRSSYLNTDTNHRAANLHHVFLDSPGTTNPIEYNIDLMHEGGNVYINRNQAYGDNTAVYSGIWTSSLTVMEVSA